jgi:hypothetical protein
MIDKEMFMLLFEGVVSGLVAGALMGLISHVGFKVGIFKSSLFIIDGSFVQRILRLKPEATQAVIFGIPVHLTTSMSFGIGYVIPVTMFSLDLLNAWLIVVYTFILWLSMLFVALPTAGQGFVGRKLGSLTWLEQMVLHVVFGFGLWGFLFLLH